MFDAVKVKNELISWIRNYFNENGKDCLAVVGLSGGKDSTVAAALCVAALGADRVFGVLMPQGVQKDIGISFEAARHLGINHCVVNIGDAVGAVFSSVGDAGLTVNRQAATNTPARIRMTVLYAAAAVLNGRVSNNCNLSEDWVGYSTKFGDSAGDFSPLSRLTVTEVKQIGRELGLPARFIEKTPIDGLQELSDEENLGFTYSTLDRYIREGVCEDESLKLRIDSMKAANTHKLNPMPCFEYEP